MSTIIIGGGGGHAAINQLMQACAEGKVNADEAAIANAAIAILETLAKKCAQS